MVHSIIYHFGAVAHISLTLTTTWDVGFMAHSLALPLWTLACLAL